MSWETILIILAFILTWVLTTYVGVKILKELKEALAATGVVGKESADFMLVIAEALADGNVEPSEIEAIVKEYKEMVAAGIVAGKEWKDVLDAVLEKVRG